MMVMMMVMMVTNEQFSKQADVHPVVFQFKRKQCTCALTGSPPHFLGSGSGNLTEWCSAFFPSTARNRRVMIRYRLYISYGAIDEEDCYGHQEKSSRWKLSTEEQGPPVRRNTWGSMTMMKIRYQLKVYMATMIKPKPGGRACYESPQENIPIAQVKIDMFDSS